MDELSRDAVSALATVDRIAAVVENDEPEAGNCIRDLLDGILETKEGRMFVLHGVSSMLIAMQKETLPATFNDKVELRHVWTLLNLHANDEHRKVFNAFQNEGFMHADRLRDRVRAICMKADCDVPSEMDDVINDWCKIPSLCGEAKY